ncbi:PilW family protein [Halomonas sp. GD1P12]|uniref:PilW family protein n=1 Tax=Halomonas sp. GD1P12 TaxID=2982691 RepID=UPI0021E5119B|nr:PilW family protein [Halomonas sp. GD1P12]UYF99638.1 PilW family protein [Halomonas sp. GD1P12]
MNTARGVFQKQTGFTLIELLVAMVIGVLVILGATQLFIASQQNYRVTTALANMQDTGRFALETLARELRQADFRGGCAPGQINVSIPSLARTTNIAPAPGLQGFTSPQNTTLSSTFEQPLANAQVIAYRAAGTPIKGRITGVSNQTFSFAPAHNAAGQMLLLQSAQRCELFLNAASQPDQLQKSTMGWPTGSAQAAPLPYTQNQAVTLTALTSGVYYLGRDPTNADRPSLMRLDTSTATPVNEVLASHVVALRARFLKNDAYVTVNDVDANEWQNVRAVRVSLIVQSERTDLRQTPTTIETGNFRSNPFTANDGRLYQVFTTTIDLRNRS